MLKKLTATALVALIILSMVACQAAPKPAIASPLPPSTPTVEPVYEETEPTFNMTYSQFYTMLNLYMQAFSDKFGEYGYRINPATPNRKDGEDTLLWIINGYLSVGVCIDLYTEKVISVVASMNYEGLNDAQSDDVSTMGNLLFLRTILRTCIQPTTTA